MQCAWHGALSDASIALKEQFLGSCSVEPILVRQPSPYVVVIWL